MAMELFGSGFGFVSFYHLHAVSDVEWILYFTRSVILRSVSHNDPGFRCLLTRVSLRPVASWGVSATHSVGNLWMGLFTDHLASCTTMRKKGLNFFIYISVLSCGRLDNHPKS